MPEPATSRPAAALSVERVFRTLADTTRLRILHLLDEGPLCVGDLVSVLAVPQPTASRHLAYLRKSGLVLDERRGQWSFYQLAPPVSDFHERVLATLRTAVSRQTRVDQSALRALRRTGGCCPQHLRSGRSRNPGRK